MHKINWDDLRFVLAVAESGSVNAAANRLGVNHATVLRRIAGYEDQLGFALFERNRAGYRLLPDSRRLIEAARKVEAAHEALDRVASSSDQQLEGLVSITTTDTLANTIMPELLENFASQFPLLELSLQITPAQLSLSRRDADITLRPTKSLPDDLVGERVCGLSMGVFANRKLLERGRKLSIGDLKWLGYGAALTGSLPGGWMVANVHDDLIVARADSFVTLAHLASAGVGAALLPTCLAANDSSLVRLSGIASGLMPDIWVAAHVDLAEVPRIRLVTDFLKTGIARQCNLLEGVY